MVVVAQLVRALDCGSEGREFESRLSPLLLNNVFLGRTYFVAYRGYFPERLCFLYDGPKLYRFMVRRGVKQELFDGPALTSPMPTLYESVKGTHLFASRDRPTNRWNHRNPRMDH